MQKARFLHGVFPAKEKANLAPRLAMICKGTARSQVRHLDPLKLVTPDTGVTYLLDALVSWEETSELKTFELFDKALYRVIQKPDEAAHSYTLRMQAAFDDLGEKNNSEGNASFRTPQAVMPHQRRQEACVGHGRRKHVLEGSRESYEDTFNRCPTWLR